MPNAIGFQKEADDVFTINVNGRLSGFVDLNNNIVAYDPDQVNLSDLRLAIVDKLGISIEMQDNFEFERSEF
jgi:hypothetical protein